MKVIIFVLLAFAAGLSYAHQPVMDMAPRWEGGYGVQTRVTHANDRTETWLEGVYTFKPSLRMTLKVPYASGDIGNAILAMPLKRYKNQGAFTSNWGLTPSVRMPTGGGDDWDAGLGLSYSSETPKVYQLYDFYTLDDVLGLDVNVGRAWKGDGSSFFMLWDISAQDSDTGSRVLSGPVAVYFKDNVIFRAEFKCPVHDDDSAWSGNYLSVGVGLVY